jgi:Family of unknown function (DUF5678)
MKPQSTAHTISAAGTSTNEAIEVDRSQALDADLVRLRTLLERGDVEGARAWVKELQHMWPDSDEVRHYVEVLAPPRVSIRRGHRGPSRHNERAWLREHARQYPGQWLAILQDQLIAADPDLGTVLAAVRQTPDAQRALLHFQPGTSD